MATERSETGVSSRPVDITFECLPLRSVGEIDIPEDASPKFQRLCRELKEAIAKHGTHNAYYLHRANCVYCLTNDPKQGMIEFTFRGTLLTDADDLKSKSCDLQIELGRETCSWLTEDVVHWLKQSVVQAVQVEFNRYIEAGDLKATIDRIEKLNQESEEAGGFMGMYL